jgi:DNA (cytosine-5)-methyltransferase 1
MIHLGDITKIDGHKVPITDVVIGGSPCQDLSVAGKRAGLDGERSGLFMEQIRIVKEMREYDIRNGWADELIRPRFLVWENVPGALSSNKGEDFRVVLEEIARVKDKDAVIPRPENGKWNTCGCIVGNGYSICWRVLDLQYWGITYFGDDGVPTKLGTPQRRRRISLVADFNTEWGASEILLERGSLPGNTSESREPREGIAGHTEESLRESGISFQERMGKPGGGKGILTQVGHTGALVAGNNQSVVSDG